MSGAEIKAGKLCGQFHYNLTREGSIPENMRAALDLHFTHYNLGRIHSSLPVTPAVAAGISGRLWETADLPA